MFFFKKKKLTCNAAGHSLLFQPSGEILPCYYNRGYILGKYPDNDIKSVWNSAARKNLVKSIEKADFNLGCYACKADYESNQIQSAGFTKYNHYSPAKTDFPSLLEFQLDNICNLECIMCSGEYSSSIRKNREKLDAYKSPYDDKFIEQLEEFIPHLKYAVFTGGEPFLINIYYKIWDKIRILNPDVQIFVSTNGTILNDRIKRYLDDLNFNFTVSIDSVTKDIYEKVRRNSNLESTLENIEYFSKYCKEKKTIFSVKSLLLPNNYKYFPDLLNYFGEKEIRVISKLVTVPHYASFISSTPDELSTAIDFLRSSSYNLSNETAKENYRLFEELILNIEGIPTEKPLIISNIPYQSDTESLKEFFTNYIIESSSTIDNNIVRTPEFYKNTIEMMFSSIEDIDKLRTAIINFMKISPEILINELNRSDTEKLIARFRQAAYFGH